MRATGFDARQRLASLAVGLLAVALVWVASLSRAWDAVEFKTFDLLTALSAPYSAQDLPIVVLAIDEPSFQELQLQWPFARSLHARLLDRLRADGAAAVGFDVVFAEPSLDAEDAAFAQAIRAATGTATGVAAGAALPVVLAAYQEHIEGTQAALWTTVAPLARFTDAGALQGDIGVRPDDDFVVRRQPPGGDSLSARLAQLARPAGAAHPPARQSPDLVAYLGPHGTIDTRSYYQAVLPGLLPAGFFKGKTVLVGRSTRTAAELQNGRADTFNSPFAVTAGGERLFPGVELQATLLANRLSGDGLTSVPAGWVAAWLLLLGGLLVGVSLGAHPALAAGLAASLVVGTGVLSWTLFAVFRLWLPPLFPAAALVALYGATALLNYLAARQRALQTRSMFSQYVPPEVVAQLVEQPELLRLGGETRELTLMFTDLANFTAMAEQLSAEQTVAVLTDYFGAMTPIIHRHGGTVDKFIGDAIMAFWGAPLADDAHAAHAVAAAIEMQQAMAALAARLQARGLPAITMRIGVHTGRVVVGNVGSATRFSYTAIGDAVNLAARLEGANKAFGTHTLVSGATAAQLLALAPGAPGLRPLDDVVVKGKTAPVRVFTPWGDARVCELSATALDAFQARQWDAARASLGALLALCPGDAHALRLLARIDVACVLPATAPWSAAVALDKL